MSRFYCQTLPEEELGQEEYRQEESMYVDMCVCVCSFIIMENDSIFNAPHTVEAAVSHINEVFKKEEAQETFKVIQSYQSDGYFPFMYQGKNNSKYHTALMREKEEGLPPNLLVN